MKNRPLYETDPEHRARVDELERMLKILDEYLKNHEKENASTRHEKIFKR